jgi:cytochrome P450
VLSQLLCLDGEEALTDEEAIGLCFLFVLAGLGVHRCLGSHLARMEMRLVYEEWHKRIPDYDIAPGAVSRVRWPQGTLGLEALPLVFPPSGAR